MAQYHRARGRTLHRRLRVRQRCRNRRRHQGTEHVRAHSDDAIPSFVVGMLVPHEDSQCSGRTLTGREMPTVQQRFDVDHHVGRQGPKSVPSWPSAICVVLELRATWRGRQRTSRTSCSRIHAGSVQDYFQQIQLPQLVCRRQAQKSYSAFLSSFTQG